MTDLQTHGRELLSEALDRLWEAMRELTRPTSPPTPLPRPPAKPIRVSRKVELRVERENSRTITVDVFVDGRCLGSLRVWDTTNYTVDHSDLVGKMMPYLSRPRTLAHCLRQLQWLTEWMRKRAEGRRRAAEEILRQQRKWVEELEGEIAMRKLAE
jgi:DNA-directed RNA polymerase specialized sigma54-like protein